MRRVAREKPPSHLRVRVESVREVRHITRGIEPRSSMVIRRARLVGLERLGRRPHWEDESCREALLD